MTRIAAGLLAVLVHVVVGAPSEAADPTRIRIDCNNDITESGSYLVRNSVGGCASADIISIEAHNVTLDLGENVIDGDGGAVCQYAIYVEPNLLNVKIMNGTVRDCLYGIYMDDGATDGIVRDVIASNNDEAGIRADDGNRFVNNEASGNDGRGFSLDDDNVVLRNTAAGNDSTGMLVGTDSLVEGNTADGGLTGIAAGARTDVVRNIVRGTTNGAIIVGGNEIEVRNNSVTGNTLVGIQVTNGNDVLIAENTLRGNHSGISVGSNVTIVDNVIRGNGQNGITAQSDNIIKRNIISGNGDNGAFIVTAGNTVVGNTANGNGEDGLRIVDGTNSLVKNNTVNDNGGYGIEADGVVPAGDGTNHARDNALAPPECIPASLCV